jgi:predicted transcriptional regulator
MDESIFIKLLGDSPLTKVLDFLLTAREFDYSKKEIAENAEISYNTLNSLWSNLLANEVIVKTRRIGKQDMFRINSENMFVKELIKFYDSLLKSSIENHMDMIKQLA